MLAQDLERSVGLLATELTNLQAELRELQVAIGDNPRVQQKLLQLLDRVEGYLAQPAAVNATQDTDEYHFHMPGMATLVAQAQQQQQQ